MSRTPTARRSLLATSALLLGLLAGVHHEAASQETVIDDAHDQARRLLQRPEITSAPSTAAATAVSTARSAGDAQEQARRLLTSDRIIAREVAGTEAAALNSTAQRVDAHTLAARLLLKPNAY